MLLAISEYKQKILSRYLLSYLVILIIPILTGIFIHNKTMNMVEEDIKSTNHLLLEQSRDIIDRHLAEVDVMVKRLALNPKVITLLNMNRFEEGSSDIYKAMNAWQDLTSYRITNSLVKEFYIYLKNSDMILSTRELHTRGSLFYGQFFQYGKMDYLQWKSEILDRYHYNEYSTSVPVLFDGKEQNMIAYMQSIPLDTPKQFKGNVIVFIDENEIHTLLNKLNIDQDGWVYIADQDGRIITSISGGKKTLMPKDMDLGKTSGLLSRKLLGRDMIISYTTSAYNQWKYVSVLPYEYVMTKTGYVKKIIWTITLITFVLGIIISYMMAYRNVKPIRDMITMAREALGVEMGKGGDEYDSLKGTIHSLINNNRYLQNKLQDQFPLLRAAFLKRLVKGGFNDIKEIETVLSHIGLHISGRKFAVIILKIRGYEDMISREILKELDTSRVIIHDVLHRHVGEDVCAFDLDENQITVLLAFQNDRVQEVTKAIGELIDTSFEELRTRYHIRVLFAVGEVYDSMTEISYSFEEARQAMNYNGVNRDEKAVWYCRIPKKSSSFHYPVEIETRLMNHVRAGDEEEAGKLLNAIWIENIENRQLTPDMIRQLIYCVRGTIIRLSALIAADESGKDLVQGMRCTESAQEVYECMVTAFRNLCECVNRQKRVSNEKLGNEIMQYVNASYIQHSLTLYNIAQRFGLTETYLYQFFKEKTGMTFAVYLEKIRIQKACELLTYSELPIQDIAVKVGYSSCHSFRRAFKRYEGLIPTEYRDAVKISDQKSTIT